MNGATAVPLVSTMSPPNMAMTMNTGSSQYFLRSSKNAVNSRRKDTIARSELVHEAVGRRAWSLSRFPVTFALRLEAKPQRVFAAEPHEPADRRDAAIIHDPQHEGAHDREQDEAELGPQPVERGEQARAVKRDHCEDNGRCQPRRPARAALVERQGRNQRRKAGKDVAEPAIRRGLYDLLPAVKLVGAKVLVVHAFVPRADAPSRRKPHIWNAIATYCSGSSGGKRSSQRNAAGTCRHSSLPFDHRGCRAQVAPTSVLRLASSIHIRSRFLTARRRDGVPEPPHRDDL